jgi:hypothetical protein
MTWYNILNIVLLVIVWLIILFNIRRIPAPRRGWLFFLAAYTVTEFIGTWISMQHKQNLWLYNVSRPMQLMFLLFYFSSVLEMKMKQRIFLLTAGALLGCTLIFSSPINSFNSLADVIVGAAVTSLCILYFNKMIRSPEPISLSASEFWFCSSLFIFFGSNFCIYGSMGFFLITNKALAQKLFSGIVINSYILYATTIFALLSTGQRQNHKIN